jgi:hypothetical protein
MSSALYSTPAGVVNTEQAFDNSSFEKSADPTGLLSFYDLLDSFNWTASEERTITRLIMFKAQIEALASISDDRTRFRIFLGYVHIGAGAAWERQRNVLQERGILDRIGIDLAHIHIPAPHHRARKHRPSDAAERIHAAKNGDKTPAKNGDFTAAETPPKAPDSATFDGRPDAAQMPPMDAASRERADSNRFESIRIDSNESKENIFSLSNRFESNPRDLEQAKVFVRAGLLAHGLEVSRADFWLDKGEWFVARGAEILASIPHWKKRPGPQPYRRLIEMAFKQGRVDYPPPKELQSAQDPDLQMALSLLVPVAGGGSEVARSAPSDAEDLAGFRAHMESLAGHQPEPIPKGVLKHNPEWRPKEASG